MKKITSINNMVILLVFSIRQLKVEETIEIEVFNNECTNKIEKNHISSIQDNLENDLINWDEIYNFC